MSGTAAQPRLDAGAPDTGEVEARLAWLASAGTEEEALVIEGALLAQTDNRPHEGDPEEQPEQ